MEVFSATVHHGIEFVLNLRVGVGYGKGMLYAVLVISG